MFSKRFTAIIQKNLEMDASFVMMPFDLKSETGHGRLKVKALFDGVPYSGSIVNMGVKNEDGTICYVLGMPKEIRKRCNKTFGDSVRVEVVEDI